MAAPIQVRSISRHPFIPEEYACPRRAVFIATEGGYRAVWCIAYAYAAVIALAQRDCGLVRISYVHAAYIIHLRYRVPPNSKAPALQTSSDMAPITPLVAQAPRTQGKTSAQHNVRVRSALSVLLAKQQHHTGISNNLITDAAHR